MSAPTQPCRNHTSCKHQHIHAGKTPHASTSTAMRETRLMSAPTQPCRNHTSGQHQHIHAGKTHNASTSTSMQENTSCQHQHSHAGNTPHVSTSSTAMQETHLMPSGVSTDSSQEVSDARYSLCCGRNMLRAHTHPRRQPAPLPTHLCTTHPVTLTFSCCTSFFQTALGCDGSSKSLFSRFCTLHTAMRAAALPGCLVLQSCRILAVSCDIGTHACIKYTGI